MYTQNRLVPVLVAPNGSDWLVKATLDKSDQFAHKDAYLVGNTTISVRGGYANFTDLGISHAGYNYKITFRVVNPSDAGSEYQHVMQVVKVPKRNMYLEMQFSKSTLKNGETFDVEVFIKDTLTNETVPDLQWKVRLRHRIHLINRISLLAKMPTWLVIPQYLCVEVMPISRIWDSATLVTITITKLQEYKIPDLEVEAVIRNVISF